MNCFLRRYVLLSIAVSLAGCAPVKKMDMLIQMMPDQETYIRKEVIIPFEKLNHVKIDVLHYNNQDSLEDEIRKRPNSVCLVKVPFDKSRSLIRKGLFKPLDSFLSDQDQKKFRDDYLLTTLGMMDNKQCLVPRKFETRIMVFSKSKVAEAAGAWRKYRDQADQEIKKYNGAGLPSNYILEPDPNNWDFFDMFVVGLVWSHTKYDGKTGGRIAQRGKKYSGTSLGLIDKAFQLGADSTDVLSFKGDAIVDAFQWEAVMAASNVYNKKMWEQGWSGTDIWQGFADNEVFLSFMTQLDCFFLHGTGRDNLNGYMKNPDDMGVATIPQGCSLELDANGFPLRTGTKSITTGGWWWGIPFDAPYPDISYKLAAFITSTSSQIQECTRFGMIPVRKDILSDMSMMFGGGWITDIYETSFKQLMNNGHTVIPSNAHFGQIGTVYLDAWYDIVVNKNWSSDRTVPSRNYIGDQIQSVYARRANEILTGH